MTNAERQRRWRWRHSGSPEAEKRRLLAKVHRRAVALDQAIAEARAAGCCSWLEVSMAQDPADVTFRAWMRDH